jgi:arylsulfatase A-like enzyme/Flp pilus assembly protein TadD
MSRRRSTTLPPTLSFLYGTPALAWLLVTPPAAPQRSRNVLLVTIDTLRADALGCYGGAAQTPAIDALAAAGVRHAFAHAHSVVTLPSHANMLTGLLPYQHGVRENSGFVLSAEVPTLATLLKARGYATGAFVAAAPLDARFGLARGFDVYSEGYGGSRGPGVPIFPERPGTSVVADALEWLRSLPRDETGQSVPWLCWVHLFEPHAPYEPPEPFRSRHAGSPYHGEVAAADAALGPLLELARAEERTLIVLTSDHGEALGEHGEATHGLFCYESTLHVPLVLYEPRLLRPRVEHAPSGHIDILPTVLEALGATELPPGLQGRSLLRELPEQRELYFEALSAMFNRGWAPLRGLLLGREKWIDLPLPELYDLAADPGETRNLVAERRTDSLRARLDERISGDRPEAAGELPSELRESLESLGYLTSRAEPKEHYTEADDPKRLVHIDSALQQAIALYQQGRLEEAAGTYRKILAERPDMGAVYVYLGFLQRRQGQLAAAVETLRRGLEASRSGGGELRMMLAGYLNDLGRPQEAVDLLADLLETPEADLDALNVLGIALAGSGQPEKALRCFDRILERDPRDARALLNAATVHLQLGAEARARPLLEQALEADPSMAEGWNTLGVLEARTGRHEAAVAHWQRTVELDPGQLDARFNLGLLLARLGRSAEARQHLETYLRGAPAEADRRRAESLLQTLP